MNHNMDYWDPAVTDGLARTRAVVLFDNAGTGATSGDAPESIEEFADHAARFLDALGVPVVDALGFSLGGYVAQALVERHPERVRKLVLVGTGPRAGSMEERHPDVPAVAGRHEVSTLDDFLFLFFSPSAAGQTAGRAFWDRRHGRAADLDTPTTWQLLQAQLSASRRWGAPRTTPPTSAPSPTPS